jgi:RNA polymerase sigma factor (sigma-70 family)
MTAQPPIRLLLVDDHALVREPLAELLNRQPGIMVVGQTSTLAEARALLAAGMDVNVALVDLDLPDGHGADLVRDLRQYTPEALAIVLTASRDQREYARAVAAGAVGVLHKSVALQQLIEAIRRAYAGEVLISRDEALALKKDAAQAAEEERQARAALQTLTSREREILEALAEGLDNEAIAERLGISERTVRNHVVALLDKLGVESRLQAVVLAARHGAVRFR